MSPHRVSGRNGGGGRGGRDGGGGGGGGGGGVGGTWTSVVPQADSPAPCSRSKHSATLVGRYIYVLCGRNGNSPLKDFWRYDLGENTWEELRPTGDCPPCLQEHTTVAYREQLYVFGGEVGFSSAGETPLWIYNIKSNNWRKVSGTVSADGNKTSVRSRSQTRTNGSITQNRNKAPTGAMSPRGRRGHTSLVHKGTMLIYGGYRDLRGSSNELWAFHFDSESWHLLSPQGGGGGSRGAPLPPARHKHSAVMHGDSMWIFGGMTDLHARNDLWRWDTVKQSWTVVRPRGSGKGPGALHSHAASKLPGAMVIFGGERDGNAASDVWSFYFVSETWERLNLGEPRPSARSEAVAVAVSDLVITPEAGLRRSRRYGHGYGAGSGSEDRSVGIGGLRKRVSPCERKYVFLSDASNYVDGSEPDAHLRQDAVNGNHSAPTHTGITSPSVNISFLKEITKLSQINLSRLSHHKVNYSVLNADDNKKRSKMVKSQSANLLSRRVAVQPAPTCTPTAPMPPVSMAPTGPRVAPATIKSMNTTTTHMLPRDNVSVPNLNAFVSTIPTPVLTPVEVTRLVFLDEHELDDLEKDDGFSPRGEYITCRPPSPPKHQTTEFGAVHEWMGPTHRARRSDSYTSHLGDATIRYQRQLENVPDETSDYASIETMNRLSSASSFCNPNYEASHFRPSSAVKMLNSPPDSLLEDRNESVELTTLSPTKMTAPAPPPTRAVRPYALPLSLNIPRRVTSNLRASSAGRVEVEGNATPPVYMFLVGGREHGQVTVFKRPLSIWRLLLDCYA